MSTYTFIDYDDSRIFVAYSKLKLQSQNLINYVNENNNFPRGAESVDLVVQEVRELIFKEHNAVIIGYDDIRIGKEKLPAVFVFDTMSDFTMFMLRWS